MNERIKKIEFHGTVKWPNRIVPNVKCFIEIDQLFYGPIKGYFLCDVAISDHLRKGDDIFNRYFSIEPQFKYQYSSTYSISQCMLNRRHSGEVEKFFFECREFHDRSDSPLPDIEDIERIEMCFYISSHTLFHNPKWIECHADGSRIVRDKKRDFTLYDQDNTKIQIAQEFKSFKHRIDTLDGEFESKEQVLIASFRNIVSVDDTIDKACKLLEYLCTLFSYCTKKRISIYKYKYYIVSKSKDDKFLYHVEVFNGNKRAAYVDNTWDCIFENFFDLLSFIESSFPVFLAKKELYNLIEAMWMFVGSFEEKSYESSFMSLCTALEAIKDSYLNQNKDKFKLTNNQQSKLRNKLCSEIQNYGIENSIKDEIVNLMLEKTTDIFNPSFRSILNYLISDFKIKIGDLEPEKIYDFIPIRNRLYHKGKIDYQESQKLVLEKMRLQILVERILLRILDYSDASMVAIPDRPKGITYFSKDNFIR